MTVGKRAARTAKAVPLPPELVARVAAVLEELQAIRAELPDLPAPRSQQTDEILQQTDEILHWGDTLAMAHNMLRRMAMGPAERRSHLGRVLARLEDEDPYAHRGIVEALFAMDWAIAVQVHGEDGLDADLVEAQP